MTIFVAQVSPFDSLHNGACWPVFGRQNLPIRGVSEQVRCRAGVHSLNAACPDILRPMRNQPFSPAFDGNESRQDSLIDPAPEARFRLLMFAFILAAVVVLGRVAWVQAKLQERYLDVLNSTTVEYEVIPARDGRILTESANVLATDVDQYVVQVHYRWLQDPIDDGWLNRQVRSRLSSKERRDSAVVSEVKGAIQEERRQMWQQLTQSIGMDSETFRKRLAEIQASVQRIADSVNQRHQFRSSEPSGNQQQGLVFRLASALRTALVTAPTRTTSNRIVVREEESFHAIRSSVPLDIAARIREQPHLFPGVRVVAGSRRTYPLDDVAPHVVGARTPASDEEKAKLQAYETNGDWTPRVGRFGVEHRYDLQLRGIPGRRRIVRNRRMEVVESEVERTPVSGRDLLLTIDIDVQRHAEQLLGEALLDRPARYLSQPAASSATETPQPIPTGGSIVVMDVTTGRILTAASAPAFSLSLYNGGSAQDWATVNADRRFPFLSRVVQSALPPGSVMKPLTAAAAMVSGHLDPDATFHCDGYLTQPDEHRCLIYRLYSRGHEDITLKRALAQSCNVYFFSAARRMGFEPLRQWCDKFGLSRKTGIDLPFERSGTVPGDSSQSGPASKRLERESLGLAIGQSSLTVTPLQMTRAMAAIANGGWLVTPHVVSPDGTARTTNEIDDRPNEIARRKISGLSQAALDHVREGLRAVVQESYGSGYKTVRLDAVEIAGKTGTAETNPGKPDHAWFSGYFPASEPQYAFTVVLEHGGSGSRAAGPVARELIRMIWSGR